MQNSGTIFLNLYLQFSVIQSHDMRARSVWVYSPQCQVQLHVCIMEGVWMSEKVPYYTFFLKSHFQILFFIADSIGAASWLLLLLLIQKKHDTCDTCVHSLPQKRLSFSLLVETVVCVSFYKFWRREKRNCLRWSNASFQIAQIKRETNISDML